MSPRSRRFINLLPKPKTYEATVMKKLERVKAQVADGMEQIRRIQEISSSFIRHHFARIPLPQVPPLKVAKSVNSASHLPNGSFQAPSEKSSSHSTSTPTIFLTQRSCATRLPARYAPLGAIPRACGPRAGKILRPPSAQPRSTVPAEARHTRETCE